MTKNLKSKLRCYVIFILQTMEEDSIENNNCIECIGCSCCEDCTDCVSCDACIRCDACVGSEECKRCFKSNYCIDCKDCKWCEDSKELRDSYRTITSDHSEKLYGCYTCKYSQRLYNCSECKWCVKCINCSNCKKIAYAIDVNGKDLEKENKSVYKMVYIKDEYYKEEEMFECEEHYYEALYRIGNKQVSEEEFWIEYNKRIKEFEE